MSEILKTKFKEELREWAAKNVGSPFDQLNNIQQSRQMIHFFVSQILEKLNPGIVPDDEADIEACIVDGAGDGGADFLYRSDEGHVLLIQAKYRGKDTSAEAPENVGRFCDLPERLYLATKGKQKSFNDTLLEIAGSIDWDEDTFHLYFITTGKTTPAVQDRVDQSITPIAGVPDFQDRITDFRYLDQTGLNIEIRNAIASTDFSNKPVVISMLKDEDDRPWCHFNQLGRDMYLGEVSGAALAKLLETHRESLFTMNIRDYVGDTRTNKQITKTALGDPTNFEFFNNGVTAVAGKITENTDDQTLTCDKLSIINGAQTVRSLLAASNPRHDVGEYKPVRKVRVLLRLLSFDYPSEYGFVRDVTRYNNTQNSVKIADFRSNDEVQKDLTKRFRLLFLKGKRFDYKNKRSPRIKNTIPITLEDFTKAIYAFRYGPDDMFGGTSKLFDYSPDGLYRKVFRDPEELLSEQEFFLLSGTYFACDFFKTLWEQHRSSLRAQKMAMHPALERRWLLYFAAGEFLRLSYKKLGLDLERDLRKLGTPDDWQGSAESESQRSLKRCFELSETVLIQQYDAKKSALPNTFKHRNWFRTPETLRDIRGSLTVALVYGAADPIWRTGK